MDEKNRGSPTNRGDESHESYGFGGLVHMGDFNGIFVGAMSSTQKTGVN